MCIFAIKYRRYVVKTALATRPESLSAGWRYDIEGKTNEAYAFYSKRLLSLAAKQTITE